jgi:hypothetical protein
LPTQIYNAVSDLCIHVSLAFFKLLALHSWDWDVASILIWYSSVTHKAGGLLSPPPLPASRLFWVTWFLVWFLVQLGPLVLFVLVPVKDDGFRWSIFHLTSSHHVGVFLCWGARLSMCKRWWINEVGGFVS